MGTSDTKSLWRQEVNEMKKTMTYGQIVHILGQSDIFFDDHGLDRRYVPAKEIEEYVMGMRDSFSESRPNAVSGFRSIYLRSQKEQLFVNL
jgi:hypothetical protein